MGTNNIEKQEEPKPISVDDLKGLMQQLRAFNLQWMEELIKQIKEDETVDQVTRDEVNERKIYNVFNGVVVNGKWKLLIFAQAKELLKHYQGQVPAE
jgi:hypothetical protein